MMVWLAHLGLVPWSPWVVLQEIPDDIASRETTIVRLGASAGQTNSASSRQVTIQRIRPGGTMPINVVSREATVIFDPNARKGVDSRWVSVTMPTSVKLNLDFTGLISQSLAPGTVGYELLEHNSNLNLGSGSSVREGDDLYPINAKRRAYDVRIVVPAPFLNRKVLLDARAGFGVFPITIFNGDVDDSGEVDAADIDAVIAQFGAVDPIIEDVDLSGEVDAADIDLVIASFGNVDE